MSEAFQGLKIFSGLAVRAAFDDGLLELFNARYGAAVVEWNPTTVIETKIARGESADLIIATPTAIKKLVEKDLVLDASRKRLIDAYLGVAVAQGAAQPKIATTAEFLNAIRQARSVAWSTGGQSGIYLEKILASHGLLDEVKSRASTIPEGFTAERIVAGAADLAVQQVSELMVVKGVDIVGPFPDELQIRTQFEIAMFKNATHPELAEKFIEFLGGVEAQASFLRNGVELATA